MEKNNRKKLKKSSIGQNGFKTPNYSEIGQNVLKTAIVE